MLCRRCRGECLSEIDDRGDVRIECPCCDGEGCKDCDDGQFAITVCARKYVDNYLVQAINMATMADRHLPQSGGILDQSAWFIELWTTLNNEQAKIDTEKMKEWR